MTETITADQASLDIIGTRIREAREAADLTQQQEQRAITSGEVRESEGQGDGDGWGEAPF